MKKIITSTLKKNAPLRSKINPTGAKIKITRTSKVFYKGKPRNNNNLA